MNPAIITLVLGKRESDAIADLNRFKCNWRIIMRDGQTISDLTPDRNDKRYNLVIRDGLIERVLPG